MLDAPDIRNRLLPAHVQNLVEVHLVQHPLDVGQADLEGSVDGSAAEGAIHHLGILLGDQSLPIKTGNGDVHPPLHPVILAGAVLGTVILHGNDRNILFHSNGVVYHDDTVGPVDLDAIHPHTAGEHQPVVGVELAELAVSDGHIHLDAAAHPVIHIRPQEGQLALPAHAARALESKIAMLSGAKVQTYPFRAEHIPGLLLPQQLSPPDIAAVKDAGEVHVEDHVRQVRDQPVILRLRKVLPLEDAHDLKE